KESIANENFSTSKDPPSEGKHFVQSPHALITHDYTQKREDKHFPCPFANNCEAVYETAYSLKAHLRRHSGEKPFICNWLNCTWRFLRSDELARHKRSHSGDKPYKCELCVKDLARSDDLSKHKKVHMKHMSQYGTYDIRKRARCSVFKI
uniref:LOW QUALITY PROTEIN: Krueppel-like factor 15 n=1 Tax=Diabrotica virgifera virgifera TaxID=50390 RepID=A0A6P7GG63_DIAVI